MRLPIIKTQYHHGNLSEALVQLAMNQVESEGVDKLSLRGLARDLGVSQAAPYRHFADKDALLISIAQRSSADMVKAMRESMGDIQADPLSAFKSAGLTYLRYAQEHPELYRLLYRLKADTNNHQHFVSCEQDAFALLKAALHAGLDQGLFKALDYDAVVLTCWSLIHGYVQLIIDGVLSMDKLSAAQQYQKINHILHIGLNSE